MEPWNAEKFKNRRIAIVMRQVSEKGEGASRTIVAIARDENANSVTPLVAEVRRTKHRVMDRQRQWLLQAESKTLHS